MGNLQNTIRSVNYWNTDAVCRTALGQICFIFLLVDLFRFGVGGQKKIEKKASFFFFFFFFFFQHFQGFFLISPEQTVKLVKKTNSLH